MSSENEDIDLRDLEVEKKIGSGSFGDVFSAIHRKTGEKYAIKRVNKKKIAKHGEYLLEAFHKELECMKKCNCDNSVKFYKQFETENNHNIIMELCDGDLSGELYKKPEGFSTEEVKFIMSQLNNAFRKLNENNIVHRDLKLGNILIKYTDESHKKFIPKLCDYGFSKELNKKVTATHLGTPATMAPEIMKNQYYDSKSDLWSVGIIIYQLHFKGIPYIGASEDDILKKIQKKTPYKQAKDPLLKDLIDKLLVEDPKKRLSWEEYFNHPFFSTEEEASTTSNLKNIIKNKRYKYIKDFDVGFKNDLFKCYIALDTRKNNNVLIKSYEKNFLKSHEIYFKTEFDLNKAFKGNPNIFQLINIFSEESDNTTNLVYNYIDCEILPIYIKSHQFNEEEIQNFNKYLFDNIFMFNDSNFKSFIFISIYSFAMTKEGKPLIFDFGISKFLLNSDEVMSYFATNKGEIASLSYPMKTNVMNYGITLLKCFYGNDLNIKVKNISLDLPKDKIMSKYFRNFISQCIYRNINNRASWFNLNNHPFVSGLPSQSVLFKKISQEDFVLIDDSKLKIILESLDNKFELINKYYENFEFTEKTEYIKDIEIFLILTLFEQLMILQIFDRDQEKKKFTSQHEISFITIKNDISSSKCNINFANPILNGIKILNINGNQLVSKFIPKLKNYISGLKNITLRLHKITKSSLLKGNYHSFLNQFIEILESTNFHNFFFSIVKRANKLYEKKMYAEAYKEFPIAEYVCEYILFVKASVFESEKEQIYFDNKKLIEEFDQIFEDNENENNTIDISVVKIKKEKNKYVLVSFLGALFRYFKSSMDINSYHMKQNKLALDGLLSFYPSLMKLLNDSKKGIK